MRKLKEIILEVLWVPPQLLQKWVLLQIRWGKSIYVVLEDYD